jgi:hypothetical protein
MERRSDRARRLAGKEERLAREQRAAALHAQEETAESAAALSRAEADRATRPKEVEIDRHALEMHRRTTTAHEKAARLHADAAALQQRHMRHLEQQEGE